MLIPFLLAVASVLFWLMGVIAKRLSKDPTPPQYMGEVYYIIPAQPTPAPIPFTPKPWLVTFIVMAIIALLIYAPR